MGSPAPPPLSLAREEIAGARATLDDADYSEEAINAALGVERSRTLDGLPWPLVLRRLGDGERLHDLIRLFLLGGKLSEAAASAALAPMALDEWHALGLLEASGEDVRAAYRVLPHQGMLFASDWPGSRERPLRADHVLGPNPTASLLADVTVRPPLGSALDVGTGCGIQALLAARHAERVVATDLNPRAANVAAFNALLNEVALESLVGNLLEPVEGRRFDLVVANPPFVISPQASFLFRDSERGGEGIVRDLIHAAPGALNEGGFCQLLCNWAEREGGDWRESLAEQFEPTGCDAWVIVIDDVEPDVYATGWIHHSERKPERFTETLDEWMRYYEREGIIAFHLTAVTMRRASGRPPWFAVDELASKLERPAGDHVVRCVEARDLLARTDEMGLLEMRLRVAPETRLQQVFAPEPGGWVAQEGSLDLAAGLPFTGAVDPHVANVVVRCDGTQTLRDVLRRSAADAGVPPEPLMRDGLGVIRRLIEAGFLLTDGAAA